MRERGKAMKVYTVKRRNKNLIESYCEFQYNDIHYGDWSIVMKLIAKK